MKNLNKTHLGFAVATVATLAMSAPQMIRSNSKLQLEASEIQQAKLAESRYQRGCTLLVSMRSPDSLVSIQEGKPVTDRVTKQPLPDGTVVCDSNGNTAIIRGSVASDLAFTGNRELAYNQLKRVRGAKVYHFVPGKE